MFDMLDRVGIELVRPWWLLGLLLIVPVVLMSMKSLAGLGRVRQTLAILTRVVVVALVVFALAEPKFFKTNDILTTIFLLDDSESIPSDWRGPMAEYINRAIADRPRADDLAGVVVFGKNARIEIPPSLNPAPLTGIENPPDPEYTDLASAIKLALASFPKDSARRIVVLSDGNENRGSALEQAMAAKALGVNIDVLPIEYRYDEDVLVEKVTTPPDVKLGETVNIDVVIRASAPTKGKLQIIQEAENTPTPILGEEPVEVELRRGINVFKVQQTIDTPSFLQFKAQYIPGQDSGDRRMTNNEAVSFTNVRGNARVLLIESNKGDHAELVEALTSKGIRVDTRVASRVEGTGIVDADPLPTDIAQLQPYDTVILADVPKDAFTDAQHKLFETNTHDMGAGLVMLGGPNAFGAGRWMNTPVEKALPVDMQLRSEKFAGKGALVMVMHASEIAQGNYWQAQIAKDALKTLSSYDYAGLIHWQGQEAWLFPLQTVGDNRTRMLRSIDVMTPGDMPGFGGSMQMAQTSLMRKTDAMTKHMIIISDGDPTPPTAGLLQSFARNKITITTVLVAAHGNDPGAMRVMQNVANATKGRFYNVTNPKALPRIYQKEIRLISRPLIHERPQPWPLTMTYPSEPILGIESVPGVQGIVLTEIKQNELVEMPIVSKIPTGREDPWPVLAHWNYGLGRSVAFTSDAGRRWTKGWTSWESYAAFWSQVIRWSMRPVDSSNLRMTLRREQGEVKVVVEATDKDDNFLNFLNIQGTVVRPGQEGPTADPVALRQTAPGRYEATVGDAEARGNYFVNLSFTSGEGDIRGRISSGVSVPYSDEYRELKSNPSTLENVASVSGGETLKWSVRPNGVVDLDETVKQADVFRRDPNLAPPRSYDDIWPYLLFLATVLFLWDVAVRRLAPDVDRMKREMLNRWNKLRGREAVPVSDYMEKLKSRKAEVDTQLDRARAAVRFEPPPIAPTQPTADVDDLMRASSGSAEGAPTPPPPRAGGLGLGPEAPKVESYTDRLLKAKQKVWEDREKDKEKT